MFYVDYMDLVYLVSKPHVLGRIVKLLFPFMEYEFTCTYKPRCTHVVANVLSRLPDITKPTRVCDQTIDAIFKNYN
jgi:hypothetical protein